jgi:hypothetical protein
MAAEVRSKAETWQAIRDAETTCNAVAVMWKIATHLMTHPDETFDRVEGRLRKEVSPVCKDLRAILYSLSSEQRCPYFRSRNPSKPELRSAGRTQFRAYYSTENSGLEQRPSGESSAVETSRYAHASIRLSLPEFEGF